MVRGCEGANGRRIAQILWIAWAVVVWNVMFDRAIVVAGRAYVGAATVAASGGEPRAQMDDWMGPAIARGLGTATAAGGAVLIVGLLAARLSGKKDDLSQPK